MSSRQLRKLQQQRELEEQAKLAAQEEEESEEEIITTSKPKPSLFANFAALEDENEDEDDDEETAEKETEDVSEHEAPPAAPPKKPKKSKKKKKSKNKPKEKPAGEKDSGNGVDDIDAALAELNLKKPSGDIERPTFTADPEYERICALLGVNTQHLKVANEMRNLFGKTAGDNHEEPAGSRRGGNRRQRAQNQPVDLETALKGHHLPGKGLPEITLRRNIFIQGKEDWPKAPTGGLAMAIVDDQRGTDGTVEFKYEHNSQYQALQQAFQGFVEMGDPQNLIGLLQRNPYHISLLGQVSKVAKDQGDHSLSSDLLERGLFNFGRASMSLFSTKIAEGKARLDFTRPENREIWLIGYQYIKSLIMKGTYRTALEWAKLLLALSPEDDPYCMRFMIHHLALRAHEFNWVMDLFESELPHVWAEDREEDGREGNSIDHFKPSLAFAAMQLREGKQSRKLLSESMQEVPWLFVRLFKELDLTAPPSIWGIEPRTDAETLFSEMYVLQTKDLWNTPEATALLMEIAHTIPKVDIGLVPLVQNTEMNLDVVRFVYLDNKPELMRLVPSDLLHRRNNSDSDPLPPIMNIYSYESQRAAIDGPQQPQMGGNFFDPIAALARLLPGLRMPDANGDVNEEENEELRREFEEEIANSGDLEVQNRPNGERAINMPMSLARRLMSMIWPGGAPPDLVEDEGNDEDENTDTDDEMPELIDQ
ncbi:transcriptional repressor TCF25-domain-containing protein [Halenospora varia]|nr:transcriptional repressor TCF25-domain-containing protein [Halenospora varia]